MDMLKSLKLETEDHLFSVAIPMHDNNENDS